MGIQYIANLLPTVYIDVDNSDGPFKLVATLSAFSFQRHWKIKVTFLDEYDPCKAPNRCLQYYKETSGAMSSFNYAAGNPEMLNWQVSEELIVSVSCATI